MAEKKREWKGFLFLIPSFAGVGIFWVIPFADVIRRSFFSAVSGEFTGLRNYGTIFENQAFRLAAGNTLRFFAVCIPALVLLSLLIAVLLTRRKKGMQLLKSMFVTIRRLSYRRTEIEKKTIICNSFGGSIGCGNCSFCRLGS